MKTVLFFVVPLIAVALMLLPLVNVYRKKAMGKPARNAMLVNLASFFGFALMITLTPLGQLVALATESSAVEAAVGLTVGSGLAYLAAALVTGLSCIGAGLAVGAGAPAAIGACSEDPKAFGKAIVFVGMGEGIGVYGLLISFMIITAL